ncbi:MAG: hypothetical protein M3Y50_06905 [Acidobacteriota bacterium]|nr:hypothetical protein [Acidobacteriota bacterium]
MNGYEALRESAAWIDLSARGKAARTTTLAVEGPRSAEVLARIGAPVPETDYAFVPWGSRLVARLSSTGSPGFFVFAPVDEQPALIAQLGIEQADAEAARTVRLEHGRPRYGEDITDRFLAQETNQSHALHFSKGCYLGQEIVERARAQLQLHRKLMPLDIDGNTAPTPGTSLTTRGNATAEITSAAFSPALAKVVALAYVRTA